MGWSFVSKLNRTYKSFTFKIFSHCFRRAGFNLNLSLTRIEDTFDTHYSIMKKYVLAAFSLFMVLLINAQDTLSVTKKPKKDWSKSISANRPKDHFMIQTGYNYWTKKPDSIQTNGIPISVNLYFLMDFPFKTDPRWSAAVGAGVGFDNQGFENTSIDITGQRADRLGFYNVKDTNHFKKYRLVTIYAEAPIELRFSSDPENNMRSWKGAFGVKVGTLISSHTRGKTLVNSAGSTINNYISKEKAKRYFNATRLSVMGRFGYGIVSIYGAYQINPFVKEGFGPDVRPFQVGITISGL